MPPAAANQEAGPLKILVADDTEANLLVIARFASRLGHAVVTACNGQEAVDAFLRESPDMVLMDVMMPVMDGLEATRRIKAAAQYWVPVIIVSAKNREQEQADGLAAGADDYLAKPINFVILEAKINVMRRIAAMQRQIAENARQLERYHDEAEEEQRIANDLMKRLIHAKGLQDPMLKYWVSPARRFSGDLIAATRSFNDDLYVILADATGHGLPAALSLLPASQIFYLMAEHGFSVSHIAREMNAKIAALTPADRFVATSIACIDFHEQTIEVWNGGNPGALFVAHDGSIARTFPSRHLPLGILSQEDFDGATETHHWSGHGQLVMCSDGLLEAENERGEAFGQARFHLRLSLAPGKKRFMALVAAVQEHLGNLSGHDDISLLIADCPKAPSPPPPQPGDDEPQTPRETGHWSLSYTLGAPELHVLDLIPLLLHDLENLNIGKAHKSHLFLILSELYNNALDHGLLRLDSSLKTRQPDGFDQYLALRQKRLATLQEGEIEIQIEHFSIEKRRMLRIRIKDSGRGFDYKAVLENRLDGNDSACGRGIPLVRSLCADLHYKGNGNEVVAYYALP